MMRVYWVSIISLIAMICVGGVADRAYCEDKESSAENEHIKTIFEEMRNGTYEEDKFFPQVEMSDIPSLLEHADSVKILKSFPRNPLSSQYEPECSEGMVALWIIEGIRQESKRPPLNALCFKAGVAAKNWKEASENNHKEVAKAYRAWWEKVKELSPEKARAIDPLKDTNLSWH